MSRIWFWEPQWYWHGWRTLLPIFRGSDEYGRRTVVLGWTITGRVIIAYRTCRCEVCDDTREQTARWEAEENDGEGE